MKMSGKWSNISYNSIPFLKKKCDELYSDRIIDFYYFIFHKREEDEKKDHIHLTIFWNHQIESRDADILFTELIPGTSNTRTCSQKWEHITGNGEKEKPLYDYHDVSYLKSKGLERKYSYSPNDFYTSDKQTLDDWIWDCIHNSKYAYNRTLIKHFEDCDNVQSATISLIKNGYVSLDKMCGLHHLSQMLKGG